MYDAMIVDLLNRCLDREEDISHLIESQLKCLIGLPAESALDFSDTPA
jgi:hypothetical protein